MATTTDKIAYATSTAITCTMASLAASATAGRSCAAVDNTTNLYDDAMLTIGVKTSASTLGGNKVCNLYFFGSEDGTLFDGSSVEAVGTNIAVTFDSPSNLKGPFVLNCTAVSTTYKATIGSVAAFFGGILPRKWGFVVQNDTGQALDATEGNHTKSYSGITFTNS